MDEETGPEQSGSQSDRMSSLSIHNPDILSVNQLLESVKTYMLIYLVLVDWLCDCILNQFFNFHASTGAETMFLPLLKIC